MRRDHRDTIERSEAVLRGLLEAREYQGTPAVQKAAAGFHRREPADLQHFLLRLALRRMPAARQYALDDQQRSERRYSCCSRYEPDRLVSKNKTNAPSFSNAIEAGNGKGRAIRQPQRRKRWNALLHRTWICCLVL